jgi:hypothetical protein
MPRSRRQSAISYDMDVPAVLLELHERGIHAVCLQQEVVLERLKGSLWLMWRLAATACVPAPGTS